MSEANDVVVVVVDDTTLKMARKPVKLQKENPAECAGECASYLFMDSSYWLNPNTMGSIVECGSAL